MSTVVDSEFGRTTDPENVTEMGSVELLPGKEIVIAKKIEAGFRRY